MTTTALIASLLFLLGLGLGGLVIWFVFRRQKAARSKGLAQKTATTQNLAFHWKYIVLPVSILLLALVLAAYFYHLLPSEVAYRFNLDGSPKGWLSREMTMLLVLGPQLLLVMAAGAITWGMAKLGQQTSQTMSGLIKPERAISLMGNIIALPQIVLGFVMADIFSYNVYEIHLMPIWLFALIVMVLGGVIMAIFFIKAIRQAQALAGGSTNNSKE
jgi:uncharacterized membrane protein